MPRWLWWTPIAALTCLAAVWGFRLGWIMITTTETDVIEIYAQKYLEDRARDGTAEGAILADCVAYPGDTPGIWIIVSCGPDPFDASLHYEYSVNRFGGLEYSAGPWQQGVAPESSRLTPEI
ncbi:MAG: hypothetical protein AAF999_03475 [Pseudomonadota bacterium]